METAQGTNQLGSKEIAIIGAGPGGLTLARLLQLKGANVKVYERDISKDARVQGAIVDLHFDSGLKVIEAAGLMDAFKANYMPGADNYRLLDKDANILFDENNLLVENKLFDENEPLDENKLLGDNNRFNEQNISDEQNEGSKSTFGDEHFRPEIDRGALRNILIDALLPGTVIWDSQFAGMSAQNNGWKLRFENGATAFADIVIGAEGYRSKIRAYVTPETALYSGATIIQGDIDHPGTACPEIYAMVNKANLMAMGPGKTLAVQPRGDGGLTFYAASLYPENWIKTSGIDFNDKEAVYAYLIKHYEGWNPIFYTLFKACLQFVPRPLDFFPLDQSWESKPNLTLLGDAAHLMPPSGEGVNTAMLDALDLSECLCSQEFDTIQAAIAAYEKQMLARAALLGKEAIEGIQDFASPTDESIEKLIEMFNQNDPASS